MCVKKKKKNRNLDTAYFCVWLLHIFVAGILTQTSVEASVVV